MNAKSRLDEALVKAVKAGILSPLEACAIEACVNSINTTVTNKPTCDFVSFYGSLITDTISALTNNFPIGKQINK
jgi:hypothetical protein